MIDQNKKFNKMALTGFILVILSVALLVSYRVIPGEWYTWGLLLSLFVLSPVGFTFSVIGLILSKKKKEKGRVFAISGIVISVLETIFVILLFFSVLYLGMSGGPYH